MDKLGRNYTLYVQAQDGSIITIMPPFTIEFDITRNTLTSANVCSLRIYNLSQTNRNQLRFNIQDNGTFRSLQLKAGYGANIPVIFQGNITQAWSVREGVNFITQIECFDGGYAFTNGLVGNGPGITAIAGTTQGAIIQAHLESLPFVKPGVIGSKFIQDSGGNIKVISKGQAFTGPTVSSLTDLVGENALFIDNGVANVLGDNETLDGEIAIINASSGLLGTPVREQNNIIFDVEFEPRVQAGQVIHLQSSTDVNFNGQYKIVSIKHRGMISPAVCGDAITSLGMFAGSQILSVQR